jgi:predicted nucleotidyltransferase
MPIVTKESALSLIQAHQRQIKDLGVRRLGLFGSFTRGEPHAASDVDLLVEFEPGRKSFDNYINLCFLLEELFERPVDLVTPESLSPHIGPYIVSEVEYANLDS